ncbi:MAG: IS66 family transposase [Acidobacteriota bacterium]
MYQLPKNHNYGVNPCEGCLDKQREIDRLKEENQRLKSALRYRERKREDGPFGSSTPSSQIPFKPNSSKENKSKMGGARRGHKGHGRSSVSEQQAERIERICVGSNCPHCGSPLSDKGTRSRTVIDLDPVEVKKILYRLERKLCAGCGTSLQAQAPGVLPRAMLGNQLLTEILESHYLTGVSLGRLCANYQINIGTVIDTLHRVAALFEPLIKPLIADYRNCWVRHADETRWRTDGESGYCWLFCSPSVSLYLFRQTRSASVAREVLGVSELSGYLVVDRYQGYNKAPCLLQYCLAHLMREVEDLAREYPAEEEVQLFTSTLIPLLAQAQHLRQQAISDHQYYDRAQEVKEKIMDVNKKPALNPGIRRIQDIFLDNEARLYHWAEDRRVPAENNYAERELRPTVIARKVSFGSQSEEGARTRSILMSVLHTLRKRVKHPKRKIKEVLDYLAGGSREKIYEKMFEQDSS